jgi:poly-gamma-glutamate biosynthesis protein PgsC/CapC
MNDYAVSAEVARVSLVLGVILSMLFYERVQLTTGGAIVPAYLALAIPRPLAVAMTLGAAVATHVVVTRVVARRHILYGRRKFEVEVLVGLSFILAGTLAAYLLGHLSPAFLGLAGIGFLVPGVLAHDMARQGPGRTLVAVIATTAILGAVIFVLSSLLALVPGGGEPNPTWDIAPNGGYPYQLLPLAVAASVIIGMSVFDRLGLRSGGFITGAYIALVSPRWLDLAYLLGVAALTWWIVTRLLMPRLLLFGRRKMSSMILVGAIVGWSMELLLRVVSQDAFRPWLGLTVATLMVPALIANDAQRQGWERTVWGATTTAVGVFGVANLIAVPFIAGGAL